MAALFAFHPGLLTFIVGSAHDTTAAPVLTPSKTNGLLAGFLSREMRGVDEIIFVARALNPTDGHWYANFGYYSHDPNRKAYAEGTKLYRLNLKTRQLTTLLADARGGGVRDPQVSYDGKKVLFSYRPCTGGMEPISYGGTFTLERILGTVPVEKDGSAYFEVPAMRSVFFVALDEKDMAVKRMQSFANVQPGEVMSCVGCHAHASESQRLSG